MEWKDKNYHNEKSLRKIKNSPAGYHVEHARVWSNQNPKAHVLGYLATDDWGRIKGSQTETIASTIVEHG